LATLNSFMPGGLGPIGVAVIFGIDELMDMGRTSVNVLGNCLATVVVARWEGEFDDQKARMFGTSEEVKRELAAGEIALAEAAEGDDPNRREGAPSASEDREVASHFYPVAFADRGVVYPRVWPTHAEDFSMKRHDGSNPE